MNKRGGENILISVVIFVVIVLLVFSSLFLFSSREVTGASALEEDYSKQIALIIDMSNPGTEIYLNIEDAFKIAEENNIDPVFEVSGGEVSVFLAKGTGTSYGFFNDVRVSLNIDKDTKKLKILIENE